MCTLLEHLCLGECTALGDLFVVLCTLLCTPCKPFHSLGRAQCSQEPPPTNNKNPRGKYSYQKGESLVSQEESGNSPFQERV